MRWSRERGPIPGYGCPRSWTDSRDDVRDRGRRGSLRRGTRPQPRVVRALHLAGQVASYRAQHGRVIQQTEMPALRHDADPAVRAVDRVRCSHERVVGRVDGELLLGEPPGVVGGAQSDHAARAAAFTDLDQVSGDEAAEAVSDDVDPLDPRRGTDGFQGLPELEGEAAMVDPGPVGKAREVPDSMLGEEGA